MERMCSVFYQPDLAKVWFSKRLLPRAIKWHRVISPLNSIIDDQIEEANAMNISALSLSKASPEELRSGEFKLLFASAENALESKFVNALKDKQSLLHQKLGLVVID